MILNLTNLFLDGTFEGNGGGGKTCSQCYQSGYTKGNAEGYLSGQTSGASDGYLSGYTDGVASVPLTSTTTSYTQNGSYVVSPPASYSGLSSINVSVNAGHDPATGFTELYYVKIYGSTSTSVLVHNGVDIVSNSLYSGNTFKITYRAPMLEFTHVDTQWEKLSAITIGEGCECIQLYDSAAQNGQDRLTAVTLPSTLRVIEFNGFAGFHGLSIINLEDTCLESIGTRAFADCTSLASVSFPNTLKYIGYQAFQHTKLSGNLIIPDSVQTLGMECFSVCTGLTSVTLGSGLVYLPDKLFQGCTNIATVNYTGTMAQWNRSGFWKQINTSNAWYGYGSSGRIATNVVHCSDGDITIY